MGKASLMSGYKWQAIRSVLPGIAVIILMTLIAYGPALQAGFIWDDDVYVTRNPLLIAPDGLKQIWFSRNSPSQYFPLVYTVFRVQHQLFDDGPRHYDPYHYHLTNVLLHIANALLIWLVLRRLSIRGAWFAAAIFALHPVHVESVAWITELKNVLSMFFSLLAVLAWIKFVDQRKPARLYYALALVCGVMALFAKTTACVLPAVLIIVAWLKCERLQWKRVVQVIPFVLAAAGMALVTIWWERTIQGTTGREFSFTVMERILLASRAVWFYAGKLAWPRDLAFSYTRWTLDAGDPVQYVWPAFCMAFAAAVWMFRRRLGRGVIAAICFFPIVLSPMLGFVSLYTFKYSFVADHYQYVASVGLIALFAAATVRVRLPEGLNRSLRPALGAALLVILMILTRAQARIYEDQETIWADTITKNPTSAFAHYNLGVELIARGAIDGAEEAFRTAIRLEPTKGEAHGNLGAILRSRGEIEAAEQAFRLAIRYTPEFGEPYHNLAIILYTKGRYAEAWEQIRKCRKLNVTPNPDFVRALTEKMPEPQE